MASYEGLVTDIKGEGRAEVTIRPEKMGIPNAPEVSRRVCHSATDGSIVKLDAVNAANAASGDWVRITQSDGARRRNVSVIFGIPLAGGIVGVAGAALLSFGTGFSHPLFWASGVGLGVLLGIILSRRTYARLAASNEFVIGEVLTRSQALTARFGDVRTRMEEAAAACGDCTLCLPETMKKRER